MRIAHLSDPHLLSLAGASVRDFLGKRWIGGVNLVVSRARDHQVAVFDALVDDINRLGIDHVVCTGDITNVALAGEFRFARDRFDRLALGAAEVTVLPGNHDAYVGAGVELFREHFDRYHSSDAAWRLPDGESWPLVRVRGEVAIVGVSTSRATPWFTAYGEVGAAQLARLAQVLGDARLGERFRLLVIHHPPAGRWAAGWRQGLHDHRALAEVLARTGAELVLHGHEHKDLVSELCGPQGRRIPVRGIQSASCARGRASLRARYRIYTVRAGQAVRPTVVREELRLWNRKTGAFADERTVEVAAPPLPASVQDSQT
jgi:3',5'-cyclic AMP phosphodiesterase CpdA